MSRGWSVIDNLPEIERPAGLGLPDDANLPSAGQRVQESLAVEEPFALAEG